MKKQKRSPSRIPYRKVLLFSLFIIIVVIALVALSSRKRPREDILVYSIDAYVSSEENTRERTTQLMQYDPNTGYSEFILEDKYLGGFYVSPDGQLAYTSNREGNYEFYYRESLSADSLSINISQTPDAREYARGWSPNGRYFAFVSWVDAENPRLFVWDGENTLDVTPDNLQSHSGLGFARWSPDESKLAFTVNGQIYIWNGQTTALLDTDNEVCFVTCGGIAWSDDGRLAFTATVSDENAEIYIWDNGNFINLSQNPERFDTFPIWSPNGAVAFASDYDGHREIILWDGVSISDGKPNTSTFMKPSDGLNVNSLYHGMAGWTSEGQLVMDATSAEDETIQIYIWDGEQAINMSQNPDKHNGGARWSPNGMWAFIQHSGGQYQEGLFVRDEDNNTILHRGMGYHAWTSDGDLSFCSFGWSLHLWDGESIIEIVSSNIINAQWQCGARIHCSSG